MNANELQDSPKIGLRDLLPRAQFFAADDISVSACTADSRDLRRGDLFVAIVGSESDGHAFVGDARQRGAAAILAERFVPTGGLPLCVVKDTRRAYGRICQALAGDPAGDMKVVAVTGTNGKTTTSCLVHAIFKKAGLRSGITGTLGYCDGLRTGVAPLTTPPAAVLADYLARMVANGCSHAVVEVSSHALSQRRTAGLQWDTACLTNVRQDHLDYHGTLKNYRRAKARIFNQLRPDGVAVLNLDDAVCRDLVGRTAGPVLTIGMRSEAELRATLIERFVSEQTFLLECGDDTIPVRTRIIGEGHIYNCLMAAAVGLAQGIDLPTIVRGLEAIDEMPGRLQRIECGQPFGVFVDYAHTADALQTSLATLRTTTRGRLICVFGAGGQRDRAKRPLMGGAVAELADLAVVTDDNPRREDSARIIRDILGGMQGAADVLVQPNRAAAIDIALSTAAPGDCVLIAGKGHESYQDVGRCRIPFDDREVVRKWLRQPATLPGSGGFRRAA